MRAINFGAVSGQRERPGWPSFPFLSFPSLLPSLLVVSFAKGLHTLTPVKNERIEETAGRCHTKEKGKTGGILHCPTASPARALGKHRGWGKPAAGLEDAQELFNNTPKCRQNCFQNCFLSFFFIFV